MDEMFGLVATLTLNGQRQRSLSDSGATSKDTCTSGKCKYEFTTELSSLALRGVLFLNRHTSVKMTEIEINHIDDCRHLDCCTM
jgi:hypothetical protein